MLTKTQIAAKIRGRMRELGYKQQDIATFLATTQATISRKLGGSAPFETEDIMRLASFLELPELRALINEPIKENDVASREQALALKALGKALERLSLKDRRMFFLFAGMMLAGILPSDAKHEAQVLRSISKFDLLQQGISQ